MYCPLQVAAAQTGLYQSLVEQRIPSQFSQFAAYGLGNNAFGQQSMFLQSPNTDLYQTNLSQFHRSETFCKLFFLRNFLFIFFIFNFLLSLDR